MFHFIHNDMTVSYELLFLSVFDSARNILGARSRLLGYEARNSFATLRSIEDEAREKVRIYNLNLEHLQLAMPEDLRNWPASKLNMFLDHTGHCGDEWLRQLEVDISDDLEETEHEIQTLLEQSRPVAQEHLLSMLFAEPGIQGLHEQGGKDVEGKTHCQPA